MAYSKAPMQDTYQTKQIPLIYEWDNREVSQGGLAPSTQQTIAQNVYFELVNNKSTGESYYNSIKRVGLDEGAVVTGNILGMYYWENTGNVVIVTPSQIVQITPGTGAVATTQVTAAFVAAEAQLYGVNFTEFLFEDGHVELVIASSETFGTLTTGGVFTACVDPDRPLQFRAYPVFLDGYLFLVDLSGNIQNSDLNNPQSWSASNFISVESYPDFTQAIVRVGSYIVALGTASSEWFYDAGNPTGTPLARIDGATQQIGYLQGLISTENAAYFVGRANQGTPSVFKIEGLKMTEVGSPVERRWLWFTSVLPNSRGHIIVMGGHRFYTVVQNRDESGPTQTYMMDLDNGMWSSLIFRADSEGPFIFTSTTALAKGVTGRDARVETWVSEYNINRANVFRSAQYYDLDNSNVPTNYTCNFTTRPLDFGNYRLKFVSRMVFGTDKAASTALMSVSWSDDDYQTFTAPRSVDMSLTYTPLYACGMFRKRAFRITYTGDQFMRWRSVEIDYNQGQA